MLYLVATPIGNLGDMSYRAVETLRMVDLIASEDTRKTSILLKHYGISKPQIAFHTMNEAKMTPKLVERLLAGENIALVTNAGTPGISDPGYSLTHAAVQADIAVTSIPGASAVITALTLADLPLHSFTFKGFPPHKEGPRKRFLEQEKHSAHTLVFYESPYRLIAFLKNALEIYGDRRAVLANDLTKKFETIWRGSLSEILSGVEASPIKGEFCICIEGCGEEKPKTREG
ncbi:MAG TPA: 16S rRNA (cytidine(1402)-2'-O)-methyltransferase [Anaerolineaceae bacterium]|nr:16S rRNA (cytidine(1402)-2'-O)-methyltransferase [Anaerolineaceae bacterium]HOR83183.1 16S rRNA (cytidine(1402)-2'-O)-methyltransferase [Anaerolineaceae bacterium]HPL43239.1 16S rRNA (cytidine(1402)-2'-O)-methyltransferase [Anaerolineaceae bacterium]